MKKFIIFALFSSKLLFSDGDVVSVGDVEVVDTSIYVGNQDSKEAEKAKKSNSVYIDKKTNLMWQDEKYTDDEESAYFHKSSLGKVGNWTHANVYCRTLEYAGFDNWRLPTLDELMNLYSHKTGLKHSQAIDFWTSTPHRGDNYWSIFTGDGFAYSHIESDSQHFRCVRDYDKNENRDSASGRITQ